MNILSHIGSSVIDVLLIANGFLVAVVLLTLAMAAFGLFKIREGLRVLKDVQEMHNSLTETIAKVDQRATECSLRLDTLKKPF